jgi:hypothetical protein
MPPRRPRFDSIPPGASLEDDVQLDELRQPWSLTFGEFLRLVQEHYGFTYQEHRIGNTEMAYLTSADGELRIQLPDWMQPTSSTPRPPRFFAYSLGFRRKTSAWAASPDFSPQRRKEPSPVV